LPAPTGRAMGLGELSPVAFSEDALTSTVLAPKLYRARQLSGDRDITLDTKVSRSPNRACTRRQALRVYW